MNIADAVVRAARHFPDHPAIIAPDRNLTYAELDHLTARVAGGLAAAGVVPGERVAIYLPNGAAFVVAYLATLRAGAAAVSVSPMAKAGELQHLLADSGATVIFTAPTLVAELEVVRPDLPALRRVVAGWPELDALAAAGAPLAPLDLPREHPAALLYTSGTTGFPKGAVLSHAATVLNIMAAQFCSRTTPADRLLCFVPLSHCFGQNFVLNNALLAGATLVIQERFDPATVWSAVTAQAITMLFGVPTAFRALLGAVPEPERLAGLRFVFNGADTAPPELSQAWAQATGLTLSQGYGLTEAGPFVSFNHLHRYKPGSLGAPVPGIEMQVVNESGRPLPPGEPGELRVRGPSLLSGYWRNPEATASVLRDGWLYTGDVACMDADGDFFLVDRVKDMINMSGFKIYPREVEAVLATHPGVADCAVVGVPDAEKGEIARALIVWRGGDAMAPELLREWLRARLAAYKVPVRYEAVDLIPRGPTGKILKKLLR